MGINCHYSIVDSIYYIIKLRKNTFFVIDGVTNRQFLFLFHYGASEIYTSDYTTRSTAGTCLRELVTP
jgi:hypothetical protein